MSSKWLQYPGSKWAKHQALTSIEALAPILPATTIWHPKALQDYFLEFESVYIKPSLGSGGHLILKVSKQNEQYAISNKRRSFFFDSKKKAIAYIQRHTKRYKKNKTFLIQQGIDLLKLNEAPLDFRVLMLRRKNRWQWVGIMGRAGQPGSAVTNRAQGGRAVSFTEAVSTLDWDQEQMDTMLANIQHYSHLIAVGLQSHFPRINQLGLDLAIDQEGRLFLIEANTRPHFQLFRHHEDRKLYTRISNAMRILRSPAKRPQRTQRKSKSRREQRRTQQSAQLRQKRRR